MWTKYTRYLRWLQIEKLNLADDAVIWRGSVSEHDLVRADGAPQSAGRDDRTQRGARQRDRSRSVRQPEVGDRDLRELFGKTRGLRALLLTVVPDHVAARDTASLKELLKDGDGVLPSYTESCTVRIRS